MIGKQELCSTASLKKDLDITIKAYWRKNKKRVLLPNSLHPNVTIDNNEKRYPKQSNFITRQTMEWTL